jgi:hypothetical protein
MSWTAGHGFDTSIGLTLGCEEPLFLRLDRDTGAYLALGSREEVGIGLTQAHVVALHEQSGAVLTELLALDNAEAKVVKARAISEKAISIAKHARQQADRAEAAGATEKAQAARTAANRAADAATRVQIAVESALEAMAYAENTLEEAGEAASAALRASITSA